MATPIEPTNLNEGRLSNDEVARLAERVADLTAAGLPLAPGLRASADELGRGRLRRSLHAMAAELDRGASVDEVLASQSERLPAHFRGLVAAGARSGNIGHVLGRYIVMSNVGVELRRKIALSLAYPLLALGVSALVLTFLFSSIVPNFENLFRDFGIQLPTITILLIAISRVFRFSLQSGIEMLIALVVLGIVYRLVLGQAARRALLGRLPVVGTLWRSTSLAEFCHWLALLLECEVPLGESLRLTGRGVQDAAIDRASAAMARDVEGGLSLADAMRRQPIIPNGLPRLISWAEKSHCLPESLHMAGAMYEAGARVHGSLAGTIFVVLTITLIAFCIGLVVIGLFMPLITLISRLSG